MTVVEDANTPTFEAMLRKEKLTTDDVMLIMEYKNVEKFVFNKYIKMFHLNTDLSQCKELTIELD
jgi:hypothetical protein